MKSSIFIDGLDAISTQKLASQLIEWLITIDTGVDAYQYLGEGDLVDVVVKFKVTDNNGLYDSGSVIFGVVGWIMMKNLVQLQNFILFT